MHVLMIRPDANLINVLLKLETVKVLVIKTIYKGVLKKVPCSDSYVRFLIYEKDARKVKYINLDLGFKRVCYSEK